VAKVEYPCLPSDDLLREAATLVARGVRSLALVGSCAPDDAPTVRHTLLTLATPGAVPFVVAARDASATYGYASHAWAVDLYRWASEGIPVVQRDRILGLLLGYSPDAIRSFEERAVGGEP